MSAFTDAELAYLLTEFEHLVTGRRLGRLATVGKDGTPHVVPVGWSYNAEHDTIDVPGFDLEQTRSSATSTGRAAPRSSSTTSPASIPGDRAGSRCGAALKPSKTGDP